MYVRIWYTIRALRTTYSSSSTWYNIARVSTWCVSEMAVYVSEIQEQLQYGGSLYSYNSYNSYIPPSYIRRHTIVLMVSISSVDVYHRRSSGGSRGHDVVAPLPPSSALRPLQSPFPSPLRTIITAVPGTYDRRIRFSLKNNLKRFSVGPFRIIFCSPSNKY